MTVVRPKHEIVDKCIPIDPKEKENDIINKIKISLSSSSESLHFNERSDEMKNADLINEKSVLFKRFADVAGLKSVEAKLSNEIQTEEARYNEELEKRKKYRVSYAKFADFSNLVK